MFREVAAKGLVEGPVVVVGYVKCYFFWFEGYLTGPGYHVASAISDSQSGPYEQQGKVFRQVPPVAAGAGHHPVLNIACTG